MKTKEELNALRNEVEAMNEKLRGLTEEELIEVAGGRKYEDQEVQEDIRLWPFGNLDLNGHVMPVGTVHRFNICDTCGVTVELPATGHGYVKCTCGAMVKY